MDRDTCHPRTESFGSVADRWTLFGPLIHQTAFFSNPISVRATPLVPVIGQKRSKWTETQSSKQHCKATIHRRVPQRRVDSKRFKKQSIANLLG